MDSVTSMSIGRIVIGAGALVAPEQTAKVFGLAPADNPHLPYMSRMFGAREVAVGALTLVAKGSSRRNLTLVGMAIDASDAATGGLELAAKRVPVTAGVALIAVASGAVFSGALSLLRKRR